MPWLEWAYLNTRPSDTKAALKTVAFCFPFTLIVPTRRKGQRKYFNKRALRIFLRLAKLAVTRLPCPSERLPSILFEPANRANK